MRMMMAAIIIGLSQPCYAQIVLEEKKPKDIQFIEEPSIDRAIEESGDGDGDGIKEIFDNCSNLPNVAQTDNDNNGVGDECQASGEKKRFDADSDGSIDCGDLSLIRRLQGTKIKDAPYEEPADVNKDGMIDKRDFKLVLNNLPKGTDCKDQALMRFISK